eukprot:3649885-Pleurochrysis_carterae.AAC.1
MRCPSRWSQVTCNSGSLCVSRSGSCKLYLKLDMKAAIELDYSQEVSSLALSRGVAAARSGRVVLTQTA